MTDTRLACFKAYDIRGRVPDELNEDMVYAIGRAYVAETQPKGMVAVGWDIRETSVAFSQAVIRGITDAGVDVLDIGLAGTEMVYFASSLEGIVGGVMVTASHNPKDYNGIKLVKEEARPISEDTGLLDIERRVRTGNLPPKAPKQGRVVRRDIMDAYVQRILSFVDRDSLKPLKLVANAGNGCAGPAFDALSRYLPFEVKRLQFDPDGTFPNGVPNPLLIENRTITAEEVRSCGADMGVAWDGDYDRCFLFDENGGFIEGYYLVGVLAKQLLAKYPGGKIVHDPRLTWNTIEIVKAAGGVPVLSKSGHSFIKETMRSTGAVYGGEMSAHHYFRDFTYADSGMIPWLLVAQELSLTGKMLSSLVAERIERYPCSGEINVTVADPDAAIVRVRQTFGPTATDKSDIDGISLEFDRVWRFNVRKSNTEPVVRINVETAGDRKLLKEKTALVLGVINEE
ncbi:phosphomannomutase [Candidatus Latescibacterota bacterium]